MKIAIDLRSLQGGGISGVENYIYNLLEHLLQQDKHNQYVFFQNGYWNDNSDHLKFMNASFKQARIPNKILNFSLRFFKFPKLESLVGEFDLFFMPNANQVSVKKQSKLIITVHDLSPLLLPQMYSLRRRLWHKFLSLEKLYKKADLLLAVSEHTKHDLVTLLNIPENKIKVIYPGIDHSVFKPDITEADLRKVRNNYNLPGKFILFISTLEPRKNLLNLIKALSRMKEPAHLVVAGKLGWKYSSLIKALASPELKERIHYLGYIEEQDKPALYKLASLVAYPSFYEGFGFVPLEAMAVGTPVVTSNVSSLPEVVRDCAILVDPYRVDMLALAMDEAVSNLSLRQNLVEKGFIRAKDFNWFETAKQTLEAFESVTHSSKI